jgi:hypothetical protein
MAVLTPQQRNTLEAAVKQARKVAELGAFNALHGMAVDHPEPFAHMSPGQRSLRNNLRSKARLLGDELKANGIQNIAHLSYELAYETWHKMLFAKFLEANNLLMHTEGVAVTMEDCEELAKEEEYIDKWDAAANYAGKMLPAIFRTDDPLMQVTFSTEERIKLESIIDSLDNAIFTADDSLGWVYQFWQSDAKAAINASEEKIDGQKLPAVTQLFTEPYMVNFLIDNTLGAWWVSRNPGIKPPVKFEYLRMKPVTEPVEVPVTEQVTERSRSVEVPAAGSFEGWPDRTADITSLDPCMGSGHFVASLFPVFAGLRMYEEGLTKEEATDLVITENLHGLELDARCTQIAAFNLALTAWKFCGHYKALPEMNLACSGIAPKGKVEDWVKLVDKIADPVDKARMENGMRMLYNHFQLAPELGSLLDPSTIKADAFTASFEQLQPVLAKALEGEADKDFVERGVMAAGIAKAGEILAQEYTLQITNVPYLGIGRLIKNGILYNYCLKNYPEAKGDLANVFLERMLKSNTVGGISCTVIPQNWLFQPTYKNYREKLLKNESWNFVARLGAGAFSQISGEVVKAILVAVSHKKPVTNLHFFGLDVNKANNVSTKDEALKNDELITVRQLGQLDNPDAAIIFEPVLNFKILSNYCQTYQGLCTSDNAQFFLAFYEIKNIDRKIFEYIQNATNIQSNYGGARIILPWEQGKGRYFQHAMGLKSVGRLGGWKSGGEAWGKNGISINVTSNLFSNFYLGGMFDNTIGVLIPNNDEYLLPIWSYIKSDSYKTDLKKIDQGLSITEHTLIKVPFDLEYWQKVASEKYPNGLPKPYSDDATQWLFHGHPIKTDNPLQVAVARMLGYRWPAESDTEMELADEARELIKEINEFDYLTDDDGIFCIPSVNGEEAGADRLRAYLQAVYGSEWNNQTINQLLTKEGASSANLEDWLRKEFFAQHCKVFQNRPFIWHIWDGRPDGFSALVNYHKLTKENLVKLIYTYLGDWIRMCDAKKKAEESGAEGLLSAANKLKEKLVAILEGEAPYDIFVRWKPLEQQPIGWEPDLNDGVRLNIRPFVEAGVLRTKFNIKWGVDRGKNPPGTPWGDIRDNDKHLSLEEKRKAREAKKL